MGFGVGFLLFALVAKSAWGQVQDCASKLVPCTAYLNATMRPPDECCTPLRQEITNDLDCLCKLYSNPDIFISFGINITQALGLPNLCDIPNSGLDACAFASPSPSAVPSPGASGGNSACGLKLLPCFSFMNATTKPPDECCSPLHQEMTNDLDCLCTLYRNPDVVKIFGINMTQALGLPTLCDIATVGLDTCFSVPQSPSLTFPASPGVLESLHKRKKLHLPLVSIGVPVLGVLVFMATIILVFFLYRRRFNKRVHNSEEVEMFLKNNGSLALKRYKYSELKKMTNSFEEKIGQGGYGSVFKGKLTNGCLVAVKVLIESKGNGQEFINEVASIGKTYHVNVVSLLGFCFQGSKRALIYEYMANGSLEKYIYGDTPRDMQTLGWEKLYKIALDIARGLEYLHLRCSMRILHLDIKPHNILLDEDFCPKISDFGLAKLCSTKDSVISKLTPRGTIGYAAPEVHCRNFGGVSYKSDVYSYGMMVLEMVGGRKNIDAEQNTSQIYFPQWIYRHLNQQENDLEVYIEGLPTGAEGEMARKMSLVGLWCIQMSPADRPSMSRVMEMLQGSIEEILMPPNPFSQPPS